MTGMATDAIYRLTPTTTTAYTYNPSGRTSTRPHAVTRAGTKTYSYDANGNMLMGDGRIMTYDYENRLSTVRKNGVTTTFVYDGDGGRVKKTVSGTPTKTTVYIGKLYVCEGTSCSRLIYAGSQRIALVPVPPSGRTASPSYFHPDHLGSTSVLTNAQGVAEEHNSYQPYGKLHTHTGMSDVVYKYTGQERDPSTGLYFYNARYYDPVLGRFISPDTIVESPLHPQTLNRYAYAGNNPVLYNDPTGHCFIVCAVLFGAFVGTVAAGIASDWDPGAMILGGLIGGISGGVGAKVGGFVGTTVGSQYGTLAGFGAGGLAGGAAAGSTSAVLYRAAGYNVNIGLAIAAGAGGGLAGGVVGFGVGDILNNATVGFFAGAAAGGAVASTIAGADPGVGTLYAIAGAGLAYSFPSTRATLAKLQAYLDNKEVIVLAQACISGSDCQVNAKIVGIDNRTGEYLLDIELNKGETGPIDVEIVGRRNTGAVSSTQPGVYDRALDSTSFGTVEIPKQGPVRLPPPVNPYGQQPNVQQGEGNYIDLLHGPGNKSNYRVPGWHYPR